MVGRAQPRRLRSSERFLCGILTAVTKLYADEANLPEYEKAHVPPFGEIFCHKANRFTRS